MDSPRLENMVLTLLAERDQLLAQVERLSGQFASLQRHVEELALACCLSSDEGLREWSQEFGEGHPRLDRLIEHNVNRYLNEKHFRAPVLLSDLGGAT